MKTVMMTDEVFSNATDARAGKKTAPNTQPEPISLKSKKAHSSLPCSRTLSFFPATPPFFLSAGHGQATVGEAARG